MLSRLERRIAIAVVVVGVLILASAVVLALRWADVAAWFDAQVLIDTHESVASAPLPADVTDDPTLSACPLGPTPRCTWTDLQPDEAAAVMADLLADVGLDPDEVRCGEDAPRVWGQWRAGCGTTVTIAGAELLAVATDRTLIGEVPLGRTAAWVQWNTEDMSMPLLERLLNGVGYLPEAFDPASVDLDAVRAVLPGRYVDAVDGTCEPDGCWWNAVPIDVSDLGPDPVEAMVVELTDHGAFVLQADPDATGQAVLVAAHRFTATGERTGINVLVRPGGPTGFYVDLFLM